MSCDRGEEEAEGHRRRPSAPEDKIREKQAVSRCHCTGRKGNSELTPRSIRVSTCDAEVNRFDDLGSSMGRTFCFDSSEAALEETRRKKEGYVK